MKIAGDRHKSVLKSQNMTDSSDVKNLELPKQRDEDLKTILSREVSLRKHSKRELWMSRQDLEKSRQDF